MEGLAATLADAMNPLEEALAALIRVLEENRIDYMVIGGIAGIAWGVQRATFDVDVTVWAPDRQADIIDLLAKKFSARVPDPQRFVRETNVLPLLAGGTRVDVIFGQLPFEERAVRRAQAARLGTLNPKVCSPEDLIVHKIVSERSKDLDDVRDLIRLRRLDFEYLDPIVRGLAADLARPEVLDKYLALKNRKIS